MATHDYVIANGTGAAVRSDLNDALAAIVSNNSGSSEPATTYAYQWWADTTANVLKIRNSANNAWITLRELDGTMLIEDGSASTPGLAFADDVNTGIFSPAADQIGFSVGGAERLEIGSSEVVFNDPSDDVDFRVESNGQTHMLFVDGGNDRVGIGTSSPQDALHVAVPSAVLRLEDTDTNHISTIQSTAAGLVLFADATDTVASSHLALGVDGSEAARIDSSGRLLVGTSSTSSTTLLQVEGKSNGGTAHGGILLRRGSAPGTNDALGYVLYGDNDSNAPIEIGGFRDGGTWSSGSSMPTRLTFSTTADGASTPTERMRIDSSGNVLIGTTTPGAGGAGKITVAASGDAGMTIRTGTTSTGAVYFADGTSGSDRYRGYIEYQHSVNSLRFGTDDVERFRIDNTGNVGIGEPSPDTRLHVKESTTGATGIFIQNSNGATNSSADLFFGNWNGSSTTTPQARIQAINTAVNTAATDLAFWTYSGSSTSERMRIDSSGNVGIGSTSPVSKLDLGSDTGVKLTLLPNNYSLGVESNELRIASNQSITFYSGGHSGTERLKIDSSGNITNKSSNIASITGSGFTLGPESNPFIACTRTSNSVYFVNREGTDGELVSFYHAGNAEGSISVSGTTVSYNGGHLTRWSQLAGGAERTEILRGSVLSNLDEMCEWAHAAQDAVLYTEDDELPEGVSVGDVKTPAVDAYTEDNEQLNRMKVSDVEGDPNVAGVFQTWDDDDDTYTNDFYCAMTGDFIIRIAQGTTVARGDLLMSAGDGTAKPQDDDIVRSKTIAKVTSTTVSTTYSDGSYCVPCVLMAC